MEDESDISEEKQKSNDRPWLYKKGQSGNPAGRPKGSKSMKTYVKEKLAAMSDDEREEFLEGVDKRIIWEMSEGKPLAKIEGEIDLKVSKLEEIQAATKTILDGKD